MSIRIDWSSSTEITMRQFLLRFVFGGLCTAAAGLIAKFYGPAIGGLFLAFPAIFPAAATLIQSHEKMRKARIGKDGAKRGLDAAALDAFGATLGCLGLIGFAISLWKLVTVMTAARTLGVASASWALISFGAYFVKQHWPRRINFHHATVR